MDNSPRPKTTFAERKAARIAASKEAQGYGAYSVDRAVKAGVPKPLAMATYSWMASVCCSLMLPRDDDGLQVGRLIAFQVLAWRHILSGWNGDFEGQERTPRILPSLEDMIRMRDDLNIAIEAEKQRVG